MQKVFEESVNIKCLPASFAGISILCLLGFFVHIWPKATKEKSKWEKMDHWHVVLGICGEGINAPWSEQYLWVR